MDRSPNDVATRLLVADEDQTTCTFLQDNLIADGYQVATATTSNTPLSRTSVLRRRT